MSFRLVTDWHSQTSAGCEFKMDGAATEKARWVMSVRLSTVGSRAFPVSVAQIWNSLPEHIVSASMLQSSRRHLTTFYCYNLSAYITL